MLFEGASPFSNVLLDDTPSSGFISFLFGKKSGEELCYFNSLLVFSDSIYSYE